jgi:hypothetical protein
MLEATPAWNFEVMPARDTIAGYGIHGQPEHDLAGLQRGREIFGVAFNFPIWSSGRSERKVVHGFQEAQSTSSLRCDGAMLFGFGLVLSFFFVH